MPGSQVRIQVWACDISGAPPVYPALMGTCIAGSQRRLGVVLATSAPLCAVAMETDALTHTSFMALEVRGETFDFFDSWKYIAVIVCSLYSIPRNL